MWTSSIVEDMTLVISYPFAEPSPLTKQVSLMGFSVVSIKKVVERLNRLQSPVTTENVLDLLELIDSEKEKPTKTEPPPKKETEEDLCVICYSRPANSVALLCGHIALCFECGKAEMQRSKKCVICRQEITNLIQVFKAT
eukprot:TRINITY_DN3136_c0_g1_i3.p1 TRINITY_DN3136_c0_g1~~TRINITY_DN3136_c0_g1_i3.p1  ORF type:complete len:140 (-),score=30.67 TRINITY_DN3136_c0_g1_i3:143-562(-)